MNIKELKKLLQNSNIKFDEPHLTLRCKENNIKRQQITRILAYETEKLAHFIQDRPKVYKLYFNLTKKKQLKVIIDILKPRTITVRTVKILDRKLYKKIKTIRRRRF